MDCYFVVQPTFSVRFWDETSKSDKESGINVDDNYYGLFLVG